MSHTHVEILLVEDNPDDADLAIHSLQRNHLANRIELVEDGAQALDFIFCTGAYAGRDPHCPPKVVLLDLKLPKVDGLHRHGGRVWADAAVDRGAALLFTLGRRTDE